MHEIAVSREKTNLGHRNAASLIRTAAEDALRAEGIEVPCLISVMLTDGEGIREVNRDFRGIDRETDLPSERAAARRLRSLSLRAGPGHRRGDAG